MNKLELVYEGVVIGSHSIDERRFQVLNFMNMLYNCIIKDNDYSYLGYSNIGAYTSNLIYELTELEKLEAHKYEHKYENLNKIYEKIRSIETILRLLNKNDSKNYKKYIKEHCTRIWEDILHDITRIYKLKYKYNDIKY